MSKLIDFKAFYEVASVAELRQKHAAAIAKRRRTVHGRSEQLVAYVNHGRWLADCPVCQAGVLLVDGEPGRCFECGAVFASVVWPAERPQIEAALQRRVAWKNQNWIPGESVERLLAENSERPDKMERG